ncbi:MAG: WD40 repeat domain-containing protein [Chloroflexota bacterium]
MRLYYSPDGSLLVSVEWKKIEVWDARTGAKLSLFTSAIESSSSAPIFSADGHFARATIDDNIQIWNVKQAKLIGTLPNRANFSADGLRAAYWEGGTVHVLDIRSNQQTDLKVIENYLGSVLGFNPTQRLVIFSGQDFAALYDLRTGQEVLRKTVDETFKNAVFNADASYFVTRSNLSTTDRSNYRATINLWHTDDFQDPISQADASYRGRDLLLSPDGKLLSGLEGACGDGGGGAHFMWNTQTGVESLNYYGGTCGPNSQIFSPDSKWLLVGWDGELDMLDVNTILKETVSDKNQTAGKDHSRRFLDYHEARRNFRNIAISADGTQVAFMESLFDPSIEGDFYQVELFQLSDLIGQEGYEWGKAALTIPYAQIAIFSPDGRWLLTDIGLWDLAAGKQVTQLGNKVAAFSPDNNLLATYDQSVGKVMLWDISKLAQGDESPLMILEAQKRQMGYPDELAFSHDAKMLYLKRDGDIQIYGVPKTNI